MSTNLIPSDKPSVFDGLTPTQKVALAYPSPLPPGIAGLVFDWTGKERLELRSDITDSYTEKNTTIHDQIALPPERFTLDASTAEVIFSPVQPSGAAPQPANPLPLNAPMVPALTPGAQQAQDANAAPVASPSASSTTLFSYYKSLQSAAPTRQALIVGFIHQLWKGRCLFTVETPWGIFDSMAIEISDSEQPEETDGQTDHRITFKKFNVAEDVEVNPAALAGRSYDQAFAASAPPIGNIGQVAFSQQQTDQTIQGWTTTSGRSL